MSARNLVIKVTAGQDHPERCGQALTVAATALASGLTVSLWLAAEAAWLAQSPGAEWTQFDERLAAWDDAAEWHQVIGTDWATGADPGEQPAFYEGYTAETQRFRPEVEQWKIVLPVSTPTPPPTDPPTTPPVDPPADPPVAPPVADPPAADDPAVDEPPALDTGGDMYPPAIEAGGAAEASGLGIHPAIAISIAGVLVAGGIAVPYTVMRRKARQQQ